MSLKKLLDAVNAAEAQVRDVSGRIEALIDGGDNAGALALRQELVDAKAKAKEANDLYITMRDDGSGGGQRITPVVDDNLSIGMNPKEIANYSITRAITAAAEISKNPFAWDKAGLELEASKAMAQKLGRDPKGFYMPWDVQVASRPRIMNAQTVGDPASGGYLVKRELLTDSFVDILRAKMVLRQAGARVLTGLVGDIDIPKKTAGATAYWIGEGTSPTKSALTFGQIEARPRTVAGYFELGRKLLKQSSLDVESMVRDDLATTLALASDGAGFHGKGAENQPRGLQYTSGIGAVVGGENGAAPSWDHIIDLETEIAIDDADVEAMGYVTNAKVRGKMKKTQKVTGQPIYLWEGNELNGYNSFATNQVSSTLTKGTSTGVCSAIFFGNWSDMIFCFWGGLDVLVDPFTNSTSGSVLVTAMQDVDIVIRRAQSFSAMLDALT